MAYVYRHIRKDINQPFYIGVGLSNDNYYRSRQKSKRNKHWQNIVSLSEYDVQIIFDDVSKQFALEKEIELISLYGRKCDGGTLCNMTLGGEGTLGKSPTNRRIVYAKSKDGSTFKFDSMYDASKHTGCSNIRYMINNKSVSSSGWFFSNTENDLFSQPRKKMNGLHSGHRKKSVRITNGTETKEFESYTTAAKFVGVSPNHIGDLVRGVLKSAKGWMLA